MRKLYLIKAKMSRFFYYKCIIPCDFLSGQRFSIVLFGQKKPPQLPFSGKSAMAFLLIIIIRQRPSIFSAIVDGCYKCPEIVTGKLDAAEAVEEGLKLYHAQQ